MYLYISTLELYIVTGKKIVFLLFIFHAIHELMANLYFVLLYIFMYERELISIFEKR